MSLPIVSLEFWLTIVSPRPHQAHREQGALAQDSRLISFKTMKILMFRGLIMSLHSNSVFEISMLCCSAI
jgi:hypothetical protein